MYYIIVGFFGAMVSVLIALASKSNHYLLAGLIPLFPVFALTAYFLINQRGNIEELGQTIQFNMLSVIAYLAFGASMYYLHNIMNFYMAVALSMIVWLVAAGILYKFFA